MSRQSAANQQKQHELFPQDHQAVVDPRIAPVQSLQGCLTEYEAADRNAEMIEEMAEDIEIAQHFQAPRRIQAVLRFSRARIIRRSPLHRAG